MDVRVVAVLRVILLRWPGIMTSGVRPVKVICHGCDLAGSRPADFIESYRSLSRRLARPSAGTSVAVLPYLLGCLTCEESACLVPEQDPYEMPLGGGDEGVGCVPAVHPIHKWLEKPVGSHSGRTRFHGFLYQEVNLVVYSWPPETADNYAVTVEHHTDIPPGGRDAGENLPHGFVESACGDVRARGVGDTSCVSGIAFGGEAGRLPVGDASHVVIDLAESETFEPARGSWRHVSQPVVAIDHNRFLA